jgi:hypothetical protein
LEMTMVGIAVAVFYVVPAMLQFADARRRRRLERQQIAATLSPSDSAVPSDVTTVPSDVAAVPVDDTVEPVPPWSDTMARSAGDTDGPAEPWAALEGLPGGDESRGEVEPIGAPLPPSMPQAAAPLEIHPLEGPSRHRFRLAALHRAHLPDWPPAVIRHDPDRYRAWQEAEQVAESHWAAIGSATVVSPYPARSTCLGAAQRDGSRFRVCFLLFPALWPVTEDQALAQAVFEIDTERGELRGWVDALRESELTEDHRRYIQESTEG